MSGNVALISICFKGLEMKTNAAKHWPASVVRLPGIISNKDIRTISTMEIKLFYTTDACENGGTEGPNCLHPLFGKAVQSFEPREVIVFSWLCKSKQITEKVQERKMPVKVLFRAVSPCLKVGISVAGPGCILLNFYCHPNVQSLIISSHKPLIDCHLCCTIGFSKKDEITWEKSHQFFLKKAHGIMADS